MQLIQRTFILVLETLGVGNAPDASVYNTEESNSLADISRHPGIPPLELPNLTQVGLGKLTHIKGVERYNVETTGFYGRVRPASDSNSRTTGHWEIGGYAMKSLFYNDVKGFFNQFCDQFTRETGLRFLPVTPYQFEESLERYYLEHLSEKIPLLYYDPTNASVNIGADDHVLPPNELLTALDHLRRIADHFGIIEVGANVLKKANNQINISPLASEKIVAERTTLAGALKKAGIPVTWVGCENDLFPDSEISHTVKTNTDIESLDYLINNNGEIAMNTSEQSVVYVPLTDLGQRFCKDNDPAGYAEHLNKIDNKLGVLFRHINTSDMVIITSSHSRNPTLKMKVNTREYLPLLIHSKILLVRGSGNLGTLRTLSDIAETMTNVYGLDDKFGADSFWSYMLSQI